MKLQERIDHTQKRSIYAVSRKATRADIYMSSLMASHMDTMEEEWGKRFDRKAWALAHAQLTDSTEPVRIFVVHPSLVGKKLNTLNAGFPARAVFNPVILEAETELVTYKNVRKTVTNEKTGRREIHEQVPEKCTSPNIFTPEEGCMSFVQRKPKKMQRVYRITVRYWYPRRILGVWVLWRRTERVEGLKSQIFQHEIQHFEGGNIYYNNAT